MQNTYLLESSVITGGDKNESNVSAEVQQPENNTPASSSGSPISGFSLILIYVVIIGAMYYFTVRPARKREKLIQTKQNEIKLGDKVVTTSGMHGKVVDIDTDTFNIEFGSNKSVIITVNKKDVLPVNINLNEKSNKFNKTEIASK